MMAHAAMPDSSLLYISMKLYSYTSSLASNFSSFVYVNYKPESMVVIKQMKLKLVG